MKDVLLILTLTAVIYIPFLGLPGWDGNEPVRVIVAKGMLNTGEWMIPMLHGKPYFTKPPLMNWLIAASGRLFGTVNELTSRLPSVFTVFVTGLAVYFLTFRWLSKKGRLFAALATLSMVGLIQKGRTAEIDSLFILLSVLSLLVWINGYLTQWKPVVLWSVSLALVGIGFLTKGPQVPAYFYLTVFAYLLIRKRVSFFFSRSHLAGIFVFILVFAVYLSFVLQRISVHEYVNMWIGEITQRAATRHFSFLEHFLEYPFRVLLTFMPWTLFILPLITVKDLRKKAAEIFRNELIVFSLIMIIVNLPIYWLLPNARVRYFLPAGPFAAIITAGLFE
ncbi:MAG: glycosyltransferase family 39 protein, partial [Nitrospirota bacterium]